MLAKLLDQRSCRTFILVICPQIKTVLATLKSIPETPAIQLHQREQHRHVCLAIRLKRQIVMPLGKMEILSRVAISHK
jgi:hypothetical protein